MPLSKADIEKRDRPITRVRIEAWDDVVNLRPPAIEDLLAWQEGTIEITQNGGPAVASVNLREATRRAPDLISAMLVDDDGNRMFTIEEARRLSPRATMELFQACMPLVGMTADEGDEGKAQGSGPTSSSAGS